MSLALLPDRERVLGPDHPETLATRASIAGWIALRGDLAGALRLLQVQREYIELKVVSGRREAR